MQTDKQDMHITDSCAFMQQMERKTGSCLILAKTVPVSSPFNIPRVPVPRRGNFCTKMID